MMRFSLLTLITVLFLSCSDEYDNKEKLVKPSNILGKWQCQNKDGNHGIRVNFLSETMGYSHNFLDGVSYKRFYFNYIITEDTMIMNILGTVNEPTEFFIKREIYIKNSKLYFGNNIYRKVKE